MEPSAAVRAIPMLAGLCAVSLAVSYFGVWVLPQKLGQPPAPQSRRRLALVYMGLLFGALVIYIVLALRGAI
jgi:hypothetical protein